MELRRTWEKQLCITGLCVTHAQYDREHHCDAGDGAAYSRIVVALAGSADIRAPGFHLHIDSQGDGVFYIPEGAQYHIIWSGTPKIEYVILGMTARAYDGGVERFDIQCVEQVDTPSVGELARQIVTLFSTEERASRIRAVGVFYELYAELLPRLHSARTKHMHGAVRAAVDYIEAHYAQDFSVDTLAGAVCVSASRLFHLFQDTLSVTPVQYRTSVRIRQAAAAIRAGEHSFEEIAVRCGFHSAAYLRTCFKREIGLTPGEYRELNR